MHLPDAKPTSVLFISKNCHNQNPLVQFLADNGFSITLISYNLIPENVQYKSNYDIAVLDCTDAADNGIAICQKLHQSMPVVMIDGNDDEVSTTAALECGAYDYIAKPVRKWELLARLNNIIRRAKADDLLHYGSLTVDPVKGVVYKNGAEIFLSSLEYRILLIFLANKHKVLSRQQLLDEIWNIGGEYVNDNTLTVYIKRIREKVEEDPTSPQTIKTVRGKGYKIGD